jgi:two-component system CheB/CheR fusion protein
MPASADGRVEPAQRSVAPLVVGVGASAGGLEAIFALVRSLPAEAPMGLVVLQHLDPVHESNLPELIGRQTGFQVLPAVHGALVEAGQIHVIAPTSDLRLAEGRLQLVPRAPQPQPHLPIDDFFASLAQDRGPRAAGVVLSGTGSDGAKGICALRRAGAATFAQDQSAMHSGMPEAAIATGCVDQTLGPAEIAARLVEAAERDSLDARADDLALQPVFPLLRRASGVDFTGYKASTVRRRIQRRAAMGRHDTLAAYVEALRGDPAEQQALSEDMLIHVTSFFRDPAVFEALAAEALPRLLSDKRQGEPLRVWVPGCSTGEEVYSLVMVLSEVVGDAGLDLPLKVFGTDLSERAIERARSGSYPEAIQGEVSPGRLQRFFVRTEAGWQIRKDVRDQCVFARQDLARDPPFSNIDLISCRNLMIYLSAALQRRVVPTFCYALRPGGVLLLGPSESPGAAPGFSPIDAVHRIFRRTSQLLRPEAPRDYSGWPAAPTSSRPGLPAAGQSDLQREADRTLLGHCAPPGVVVSDDLTVVQFRGQTGPYLEPAPGTASLDLLRLVREELRVELRATIERARQSGKPEQSHRRAFRIEQAPERQVVLEVLPLRPPAVPHAHFIVLFREEPAGAVAQEPAPSGAEPAPGADPAQRAVEEGLRAELASTRGYLHSVIEQLEAGNEELRAGNEEIVSSNEELQSANEELQTAKEELQATNEELSALNDEMVQRNAEATRLGDDLTNVLNSSGIAILILGRDARIRRFTPPAARLLNLIAADVGRPISDIQPNLRVPELLDWVREVLEQLIPKEQVVTDQADRSYQLTVRPYLTSDRKVDGAVVTVVDIDAVQRGRTLLAEARDHAKRVVDTARENELRIDAHRKRLQEMAFDAAITEERLRRKLAADLHDNIGQMLALAQLRLRAAEAVCDGHCAHDLAEGTKLIGQALASTQSLTFELSPPVLYDLGLPAAVAWLGEQLESQHHLAVAVESDEPFGPLDDETAGLLFRAVRELLVNVVKHAKVGAAKVSLHTEAGQLSIVVADGGVGFDREGLEEQRFGKGFGLFSVREQVARLGGNLEVTSGAGAGTQVTIRLPIARAQAGATGGDP